MSWDVIPLGNLFIVADGMGGQQGGAVAAELTVTTIREELEKVTAGCDARKSLIAAIAHSNITVYEARRSPGFTFPQMGSTVVALLISGNQARIAHVGDSRAYLFRNRALNRLTTDHTRVQEMVEKGLLSPEEAEHHPDGHILQRAIGAQSSVEVDIDGPISIQADDGFLLCSDGLSSYVVDDEIERTLNSITNAQETCRSLAQQALDKGGHDNITIQYINIK